MKNKLFFQTSLFILLLSVSVSAQSQSNVLFTIGNEQVTKDEFKYIYEKNNSREDDLYSKQDVDEYLDLYIKFKLKVKAAEDAGIDTTEKFKREFKTYRDQLAKPYLSDKQVTEELIEEAYNRMKYEIKASHILIAVPEDASPEDTMKAYKKISDIRDKALAGEDFGELAQNYSDDPTASENKGDLGYFTVFQMIYPFESAAYKLKVGEISPIIRTRFGYHIIKVLDKRPNRGEVTVAHIMITDKDDKKEGGSSHAKAKIDSIYNKLQQGASFEDMVEKYSEDVSSKRNGGKLPKFNSFTTYLPEEFKDEAFKLKKDGEISKPFKTQFGWHIIKRISAENIKSIDESRDYLRNRVSRDERSSLSEKAAISNIKKKRNFQWDKKGRKAIDKSVDNSLLEGKWKIPNKEKLDKPLFSIGDKEYSALDFATYLEDNQENKKYSSVDYAVNDMLQKYVNDAVLNYEDANLEKFYPEFRNLVKEYKEGIMLFEITDEEVWSKAMKDTAGLKSFYENNKKNYMYDQRISADIFACQDKKVADEVEKRIKNGEEAETITADLNKKDALNVTLSSDKFEKGKNDILEKVDQKPGVYEVKQKDNTYIVKINGLVPPEPKPLETIRGLVIADYQDYLEKKWIEQLKQKYPVNVNEDVLESLYKS